MPALQQSKEEEVALEYVASVAIQCNGFMWAIGGRGKILKLTLAACMTKIHSLQVW